MQIQIDYRLTGSGWAECVISSDGQTCLLTASYLSDALRSLVIAANGVLAGFSALTFRFNEEPGEFRWVITTPRLGEIQIDILKFPELWGGKPDADGDFLCRSCCRPIVFAKAVADVVRKVLETYGESGYREKWDEHAFPAAQYADLLKAIEQDGGD